MLKEEAMEQLSKRLVAMERTVEELTESRKGQLLSDWSVTLGPVSLS